MEGEPEVKTLQCKNCTAPLNWDGVSDIVVCPYCGSRYTMRDPSRMTDTGEVLRDGIGRGTIAAVPNIMQDAHGASFLKCYVPKGWQVRTGGSGPNYGDPDRDGVHVSTTMGAPDDRAFIIIRSQQTVRHVDPSFMNPRGERRMNLMGVMAAPTAGGGGLEGATRTAAEYEDEMVLTVEKNAQLTLLKEEDADEKERQTQAQILSAYAAQGMQAAADWKRRYYTVVLPDGNRWNAVAETRIISYEQPTMTGQMANGLGERFGQAFSGRLGGILGNGMRRMQNALRQRFWAVQYELLMIAREDAANAAFKDFMKVRSTVQYLPAFEQFRQQSIQYVMQCRGQMAADRAASNQRRMAMMMDTQREIHNTMDSMNASTAASNERVARGWSDVIRGDYGSAGSPAGNVSSMDRVRNGWSEMIKETNTFYGNDGNVYEASTSYDHVYQGNQDQDTFIGTSGTSWEPGVDFDELNKTNGNY